MNPMSDWSRTHPIPTPNNLRGQHPIGPRLRSCQSRIKSGVRVGSTWGAKFMDVTHGPAVQGFYFLPTFFYKNLILIQLPYDYIRCIILVIYKRERFN